MQVHLEVVPGPLVPGAPQVRGDRQLGADVVVEHGQVPGHDVAGVEDAEPEPGDGVEPLLEAGATDARAGEREGGDWAQAAIPAARGRRHVVAVRGDVDERRAEALPARLGDAELSSSSS